MALCYYSHLLIKTSNYEYVLNGIEWAHSIVTCSFFFFSGRGSFGFFSETNMQHNTYISLFFMSMI